jgi:hypothetical protein
MAVYARAVDVVVVCPVYSPGNLYIILVSHNELHDDDTLNVETCSSMLFVIIVFDIIVQSLVKL